MAFNLLDLFSPAAMNRLINPNPIGAQPQNMLVSRDIPQDPQISQSFPLPAPAVDPQTTAAVQAPAQQPVAGTQVASSAPSSPSFLDKYKQFWDSDRGSRLRDMFAGWAMGSTPQQSLALGAAIMSANSKERTAKNQTLAWLKGRGVSDDEATFLSGNPTALADYLKNVYAAQRNQGLLNVGKGAALYDTASKQWITPPEGAAGSQDEYGLTPIYGKDAQGNIIALQPGKHGTVNQLKLPDGVTITPPVQQTDLGTSVQYRDKFGNVVDSQQKDIRGKAAQEVLGKQEGGMEAAAPADYQSAQNALDTIDAIRRDPNKGWGTGASSLFNSIPGTYGRDFQNKVDAAKSGAFLTAIQQMRGLGSLSDAEGQAATKAVNRLDTSTSEQEFNSALDDYEKIVRQGQARAAARMKNAPQQAPTGTAADIAAARDAIARGAPRDAVIKRLQSAGIDTSGL
ncbi:hypothetical protein PH562_16745 [Rhizobium sp. CNPSo 4062]|uniref:hypothetical protein n=1 Tax=Rhizobium sp. CNPSo 4062 TaxID=3021410 RepID=UPI00254DD13B|nr:hypothetical protein [Rhizobium sp. CNPSo 4062]MDK4703901.1 hypothetical protein [Rhizobium sp. CNPSo 4062]